MGYAAIEISVAEAAPVELYEFSLGGDVWRYTSADANLSHGGNAFASITISRSEIEETGEINQATLSIRLPVDNPVPMLFLIAAPSKVVLVKIFAKHRSDPDGEALILFMGRVLNCEWSGREAVLSAEPVYTSIRQPGLRRTYSRFCQHMIFSTSPGTCMLDEGDWAEALAVTAMVGRSLTLSGGHAGTDNFFAGGALLWIDGAGRGHRRMIESHSGSVATLIGPIVGLAVGASVTVWPGCDHTLTTCRNKFANNLNYGGFKWMPGIDPWVNPVF